MAACLLYSRFRRRLETPAASSAPGSGREADPPVAAFRAAGRRPGSRLIWLPLICLSLSAAAQPVGDPASAPRPRLFMDRGRLERLRAEIRGSHRVRWEKLRAAAEKSLSELPPEYREPAVGGDPTRPGTLNDEMLWQRRFGYVLPGLALACLLDDDPRFFEHLRTWVLRPASYPLWGAGIYENTGLAAKHQLFGMSIAYDWLYDRWSGEERRRLQETLRFHGRILYEAAAGINDRGWWKTAWRQNHAWNGYQALAVTAIALAGEEPAAPLWLEKALWGGRHIVAELPDEGAYEEGIPYWGYGMEALMRFVEAVKPWSGYDFYSRPYFRHTPLFRLYMAGPDPVEAANFGDGRTTDWHSVRTTMYRLASQYRDPLTQWLAEQLPDRDDLDAAVWNLLWYDPTVPAEMPDSQPLSHVFPETGFAGARTDWTSAALTLHLRSGRADVSHSHLDVNNFLLNAGGEWLLRDYGYGEVGPGYFNKQTLYFSTATWGHNCLVIGGRAQRRSDDSIGRIVAAEDRNGLLHWRSDATSCYDGAEQVVRDLILVRPQERTGRWGYVVVRDTVRLRGAEPVDFMLQPGGQVTTGEGEFLIQGKHARLLGRILSPLRHTLTVHAGLGERINVPNPLSLRISSAEPVRHIEFLLVLVPLAEGEAVPAVFATESGLRVGQHFLQLEPLGAGSRP